MKKCLLTLICLYLLLAACGKTEEYMETKTEEVPASYGKAIEMAKEAFDAQFADFEDLNITETATAVRADNENRVIVQISYESKNGSGSYGYEYEKNDAGQPELIRQGEEVTADHLSE